jgi:NADPH:quinone reductase-like Zn-dependent oxidoreductase
VLIARVLGARSIGTSRSSANLERLRGIGLDVGIETRAADFSSRVREATGGTGAHLAVNLVGASVAPEMIRSLAYAGRFAIVGYVDGTYHAEVDFEQVHLNRYHIFGISNAKLKPHERFETTRGFARDILPAIVDCRISPVVDRVFPFAELPAARVHMDSGARVGKVVVRVS